MPSHSTHINYYTRPACMGLGTLKITNFPIINRTAGLMEPTVERNPHWHEGTQAKRNARRRFHPAAALFPVRSCLLFGADAGRKQCWHFWHSDIDDLSFVRTWIPILFGANIINIIRHNAQDMWQYMHKMYKVHWECFVEKPKVI